jgi:hypothetical protein
MAISLLRAEPPQVLGFLVVLGPQDEVKLALMRQLGTAGQVAVYTAEEEQDEIGLDTHDAVDMEGKCGRYA